jgi:hypothetical protein
VQKISAGTSFGQVIRKRKAMPGLSAFVSDATKKNAPGFDYSAFERVARYLNTPGKLIETIAFPGLR